MTQEEIDKVYSDLSKYEKEVAQHNEQLLRSLGKKAQRDFEELLDGCNLTEKINFVDAPKGKDNNEDCGVYKNIHVHQWSNNLEGDSFSGFIYAKIKEKWIEVPFEC